MVEAEKSDQKGCCDDETEIVKTEEDQIAPTLPEDSTIQPALLATLLVVLQLELPEIDRQTLDYLNYKPPLLVCDYPSQLQIFLC